MVLHKLSFYCQRFLSFRLRSCVLFVLSQTSQNMKRDLQERRRVKSQLQLRQDEQEPKNSHGSRRMKEKLEQNSAGGNKYFMYAKRSDAASLLQTVTKRLKTPSFSASEDEQSDLKWSESAGPFGLTGAETGGGDPE